MSDMPNDEESAQLLFDLGILQCVIVSWIEKNNRHYAQSPIVYFKRAGDLGHADARFMHAWLLIRQAEQSPTILPDEKTILFEQAIKLLELPLLQNNPNALWLAGMMYHKGYGTINSQQDEKSAVGLWVRASKLGHAAAMFDLATLPNVDIKRKLMLISKATELDYPPAMFITARLSHGKLDYPQAIYLYEHARYQVPMQANEMTNLYTSLKEEKENRHAKLEKDTITKILALMWKEVSDNRLTFSPSTHRFLSSHPDFVAGLVLNKLLKEINLHLLKSVLHSTHIFGQLIIVNRDNLTSQSQLNQEVENQNRRDLLTNRINMLISLRSHFLAFITGIFSSDSDLEPLESAPAIQRFGYHSLFKKCLVFEILEFFVEAEPSIELSF